MNESKHTPGPWRVSQTHGMSSGTPRNLYTINGASGTVAATPNPGNADNAANAALIAAAPDMLAALADAYRLIFETPREQVDAITWQAWAAEHSRALRAIAEGRQ